MITQINSLKQKNERPGGRPFVLFLCGGVILTGLDLFIKHLAFRSRFFEFLNNFQPVIGKENFKNYAFAFSWPVPGPLIYVIYALVMLVLVVYVLRFYKNFNTWQAVAWTLIFAGAFSNIGERIALGYVRDFIYIWHGIFNLADFYIIVGILLLIIKAPNLKNQIPNKHQ